MYLGKKVLVLFVIAVLLTSGSAMARDSIITKTFSAKEKVDVSTVSGDLVIVQGNSDEILVEVAYDVKPRDAYEPIFKERKNSLRLSEDFYGRSSSGRVQWTVTVPKGTEIEFSSASGDFRCENYAGDIECETASGDFEIMEYDGHIDISTASGNIDCSNSIGKFELSTASGDINLKNCKGEFKASSASGDVDITEVSLNEESDFSSASGDVYVMLAQSPKFDMSVSSASGNSTLNFNGNPIEGSFEFAAKVRRGHIESPFKFDTEETVKHRGDRDKYMIKTFQKGSETPFIYIHTASGDAVLEEN